MRIKSRLAIATGLVAVAAAVFIVMTLMVTHDLSAVVDDHRLTWEVDQSGSKLQTLGYDYLISGDEQVLQQWRARHAELQSLLALLWQARGVESALVEGLLSHAEEVVERFNALVLASDGLARYGPERAEQARQHFRPFQLALTRLDYDLRQLDQRHAERVLSLKQRLLRVALMGLLLTMLAVGIAILWLNSTVLQPLARLTKAIDGIDIDDLDRRIGLDRDDEVGQLARAFNRLLSRLRHTIASRDRMEAEAGSRASAERDLKRSNQELEQFASVASHDLQEPLRTITSFLQLYLRRYGEDLDQTATAYLNFAIDGARRMKLLIDDLLTFSRLGTRAQAFESVDLNEVVALVEADLANRIAETDTRIETARLPRLLADRSQLAQLFSNLILNAIRYRSRAAPLIRITAKQIEPGERAVDATGEGDPEGPEACAPADQRTATWVISVADNGIGIEPQYFDRIFQIFQRLHTRAEYPGTGIGLAICQRIVERHGGRIWVASTPGKGSVFSFSLPVY
ncbi:MAG: ATP-binding protein [Lamprobacter sp.]|uniref:sensor histidine kinase n=1 Tax=Lamprobacter sp. TaxID=3100796 RepID=UPI002B25D1D2|nr:ATP-binding protein [Lamprobacter sp.]MEA3641422.1 ATP-binding protein [Lamprobacter sp.]